MKTIVLLFSLSCSFLCCCQTNLDKEENDSFFVNYIYTKKQDKKPNDTVFLNEMNDNSYLVSLLDMFYQYEREGNNHKLDSLRSSYRISEDGIHAAIFNKGEYGKLVSQKHTGKWDATKFAQFVSPKIDGKASNYQLTISKPLYTTDGNIALVLVATSTSSYVMVFEKKNGSWVENGLIFPMLS